MELHKPALESCEKVLKEDPDNVKALFRAGKVDFRKQKFNCSLQLNEYLVHAASIHVVCLCVS